MLTISYPLFHLYLHATLLAFMASQFIFAILVASYVAPLPGIANYLFRDEVRLSGLALSLNIGTALLGGTASLIDTVISHFRETLLPICLYLAFFGVISLIAINMIKYTRFDKVISNVA